MDIFQTPSTIGGGGGVEVVSKTDSLSEGMGAFISQNHFECICLIVGPMYVEK